MSARDVVAEGRSGDLATAEIALSRELAAAFAAIASEAAGLRLDDATGARVLRLAVARELAAHGLERPAEYLERLRTSPPEVRSFVEELTVGETWFFRDQRPFSFLREWVETTWRSRLPQLRALSLACSTGEEPYSLAMTLLDSGLAADQFRVDAIDISGRKLTIARRATYREHSFRDCDPAVRARHFAHQNDGFRLHEEVTRTVRFQRASVLAPGLLAGEPSYQVILCRNLLIYLTDKARSRVRGRVGELLAADGLLFSGHAELLNVWGPEFEPVDVPAFAYRRVSADAVRPARLQRPPATARVKASSRPTRRPRTATPRPAAASPQAEPGPDLDAARRLADAGRLEEAGVVLARVLAASGPSSELCVLQGLIHVSERETELAEEQFQRALYLQPDHHEALVCLASLKRRSGDVEQAERLRLRARRSESEAEP